MAAQGSLGVTEQQFHDEYRAHTGAKNFEYSNLPAEYKDLLVRMLSIQARIELEYMLVPERTLQFALGKGAISGGQGRVCGLLGRRSPAWQLLVADTGRTRSQDRREVHVDSDAALSFRNARPLGGLGRVRFLQFFR